MNEWSTGLFACCDDAGICLYGWCCPLCLYGENAQKIDGSGCCGACCVYWLLAHCDLCWIVHMGKRQTLRQKYGLKEDCNDCIATACCGPCAICQEARELKNRSQVLTVIVPPTQLAPNPYPY